MSIKIDTEMTQFWNEQIRTLKQLLYSKTKKKDNKELIGREYQQRNGKHKNNLNGNSAIKYAT